EIEYKDHRSPSVYFTCPVVDGKGLLPADSAVAVWTTTPWTIPANMAIALHPEFAYVLAETDRGLLLMAEGLMEQVAQAVGLSVRVVAARIRGPELVGVVTRHTPFDPDIHIILADHATLAQGMGGVPTAPGHGLESYER